MKVYLIPKHCKSQGPSTHCQGRF